jgi:hypothetical protein
MFCVITKISEFDPGGFRKTSKFGPGRFSKTFNAIPEICHLIGTKDLNSLVFS